MEKRIRASRIEEVPTQRKQQSQFDYTDTAISPLSAGDVSYIEPSTPDDSSSGQIVAWVVGGIFVLLILVALAGGGSGSTSSSTRERRDAAPDFTTHDDYLNATESERKAWAGERARQYNDAGIDRVTGDDLKEALDAFYSE